MKTWNERVVEWGHERNLIKGSTPHKQFFKLMEEYCELVEAVHKNDVPAIRDAIGDICVVLALMAEMLDIDLNFPAIGSNNQECSNLPPLGNWLIHIGVNIGSPKRFLKREIYYAVEGAGKFAKSYDLDFLDCLESAWLEIKDRKGKMVDGLFVKDA